MLLALTNVVENMLLNLAKAVNMLHNHTKVVDTPFNPTSIVENVALPSEIAEYVAYTILCTLRMFLIKFLQK